MRSSVPRDEKLACSAALAQSRISRPGMPGMVDGRPMPISMDPLLVAAAIVTAAMVTGGGLSWLLQRLLSACTPQSRGDLPGGPNRIVIAGGHAQISSTENRS